MVTPWNIDVSPLIIAATADLAKKAGRPYSKANIKKVRNPVMQESTITVKGQTTLPKDVRAALGVGSGDRVRYIILDGEVRLLKARPVAGLAGLLAQPGRKPVSLDTMEAAIAAGATDSARPAE